MLYTHRSHTSKAAKQPTVVADDGVRGQVLSTDDGGRYLLIMHSVWLCVQHGELLGVTALADTCSFHSNSLYT